MPCPNNVEMNLKHHDFWLFYLFSYKLISICLNISEHPNNVEMNFKHNFFIITISYQSIITSGYTMFLVIGSFKLVFQIALIFQTDVTREAAT